MGHIKLISEVCMRQGWQHEGPDITVNFRDGRKQLVQSELYLFEGDDLAMTETLLMSDSAHDQLGYAVRFLAETSDGYEKQIYGTDQH
jgi:hypothetical protein